MPKKKGSERMNERERDGWREKNLQRKSENEIERYRMKDPEKDKSCWKNNLNGFHWQLAIQPLSKI